MVKHMKKIVKYGSDLRLNKAGNRSVATPDAPILNQIDNRYMTVFPFVKSCAGDPNLSAKGALEGLNPRTPNTT